MGTRGGRRDWVLGATMALVLAGVAGVTLALREGEALTPPEPEPPLPTPAPPGPDEAPIDRAYAFLPAPLARALPPNALAPVTIDADAPGLASGSPLGPLPARVTVMWNPATQQAKVFVGQTFVGIAGQGGVRRGVVRCTQILRATPEVPIVIDAVPALPWAQFVRVFAALRTAGATAVRFAAGTPATTADLDTARPGPRPGWEPPALCDAPGPVDETWGARGALQLAVDLQRWSVIRFGDDRTPEALDLTSLRTLLANEAGRHPDPRVPQLSTRRVALFLPPDAEWRHAEALMRECAGFGLWDIAFAVAAPATQAAGAAGR